MHARELRLRHLALRAARDVRADRADRVQRIPERSPELAQALAGLQKIEEDFVATVSQVAESASERVRPDLKEAVSQATKSGTETGRKTAAAMTEFTRSLAGTSIELTLSGMELAGALGVRFAKIASGVLAGAADALDKASSEAKKNT